MTAATPEPFAGYADALTNSVRKLERRTRGLTKTYRYEPILEEVACDYETQSGRLARRTWEGRQYWEEQLAVEFESTYSALDQAIGLTHGVSNLLVNRDFPKRESDPPQVVRYAVSLVFARAISVSHEIAALLRGGFPPGALARWRTLHELSVVSAVLRVGNRGTAARYVNHRWVLIAKEISPAEGPRSNIYDDAEIQRKARVLIRRYGAAYEGTYGWAAEVTKRKLGIAKPQFWHLERLASTSGDRPKVQAANRSVHADAVGPLQLIEASGLLHPGAWASNIEETALPTIRCLGEITDSLLAVWGGFGQSRRIEHMRYISKEVMTTLGIASAPAAQQRIAQNNPPP